MRWEEYKWAREQGAGVYISLRYMYRREKYRDMEEVIERIMAGDFEPISAPTLQVGSIAADSITITRLEK